MKKKKLIVILLVLLLLGGGGAGAAWWFLLRAPDEEAVVEETPPEVQPQIFVELDPMVLPVIADGRVIRHLTMLILMEVPNDDSSIRAKSNMLRLRDAFRVEMSGLLAHKIIQGRPDVMPLFSKRLKVVADRVLGKDHVQEVLVTVMDKRELGEV